MIPIACYPKAGSTWLRLLLSAFRGNGKVHINDMYYKYGDPCRKYLRLLSPAPFEKLSKEQFFYLRYGAVQLFQMMEHPATQVYKTHGANVHYKGLPWFPKDWIDRVIYIARDPRDIVVSYARHIGQEHETLVEVLNSVESWSSNVKEPNVGQPITTWSTHAQSWLTDDLDRHKFVLRYEDLKTDTEQALVECLKFIGCDEKQITTKRVKESIKACYLEKLKKQEKEYGFLESSARNEGQFFWRGKVGGWKDDLAPELAKKIENAHQHMMEQFGYLEVKRGGTDTY